MNQFARQPPAFRFREAPVNAQVQPGPNQFSIRFFAQPEQPLFLLRFFCVPVSSATEIDAMNGRKYLPEWQDKKEGTLWRWIVLFGAPVVLVVVATLCLVYWTSSQQWTILWIENSGGIVWIEDGHVRKVHLRGSPIRDLSPLARLKYLQELNLEDTKLSDVSPLAQLTTLETLNLDRTNVRDVSPLANLDNLKFLYLGSTRVSDVSPLAELNIRELDLSNTQVSDVSPLSQMKNLRVVDLSRTQATDLSRLGESTWLKVMYIEGIEVNDREMRALRKAFPICDIDQSHH